MTPTLTNDLLARLSGWATEEYGLRFPPDRWSELARGIASAALELGIPDLAGWSEHLAAGEAPPAQVATVANHLTISETYFFRHYDTFALLEREIFPARIAARKAQGRALRIWSSGCASGEEPYSIAILLRQRFPELRRDQIAISATDINSRVLARAERGLYSEWSFRDVPDWVKATWFRRKSPTRYELLPEIRQMVRFKPLNLAAAHYPAEFGAHADFDVVLCRNVLMYFSATWQETLLRRYAEALAPEGWLIVGPCDVTAALASALHLQLVSPGIYQKGSNRTHANSPTATLAPLSLPLSALSPIDPLVELPPATPLHTISPPAAAAAPLPPAQEVLPSATESDIASALAHSHANRGELDEALAACDRALAIDRTDAASHYLRACILQEQNRLTEAAEAFRTVLFLDPRSVMAEFALGSLATRTGDRARARHHFSNVLNLLGKANRGDVVPGGEGLTVARLRAVVEHSLADDHAA